MRSDTFTQVFNGLVTSLDDRTAKGGLSHMTNARILDGSIKFRYGFMNDRPRPASFQGFKGFGYFQSFNIGSAASEFVTVEKRGGVVKPYSTSILGVSTEITTAETLPDVDHSLVQFNNLVYALVPGQTKSLYRHVIGNNTSWVAVQDSSYTAPPSDPAINVSTPSPVVGRLGATADTNTFPIWANTHLDTSIAWTADGNGNVTFKGFNQDNGPAGGELQVQNIYTATANLSGSDYLYFKIEGLEDMETLFTSNSKPEFRVGGVWTAVTDAKWFQSGKTGVYVMYVSGMTLTAVEGVRFSVFYDPRRGVSTAVATKDFMKVYPLYLGGSYIESSVNTQRLWDSVLIGDGVRYGVRYTDGGATVSSISETTITVDQARGYFAETWACPVGGIVNISVSAPTLPYTTAEFLRYDPAASNWKIIGTLTAANWIVRDSRKEYEIPALVVAGSGTPLPTPPTFTTDGILCAVQFKGFMVWCFKGVTGNIRMSRVLTEEFPDAQEELYNPQVTYDDNDTRVPSTYTMGGGTDEPRAVIADDDNIYYLGNFGVYAQSGEYPSGMSAIRPVPNSSPVAGVNACCIFPPEEGRAGLAYVDNQGDLWFVSASRSESDVVISKPIELSKPIRGFIKRFLLDEQRNIFGYSDLSGVRLAYSSVDNSLRVALGTREVVYRPRHLVTNQRFFEAHDYTLRQSVLAVSEVCTAYSGGVAAPASIARGVVWASPASAANLDGVSASVSLDPGESSDILRNGSVALGGIIPPTAILTKVKMRITHSKTGDLPAVHDEMRLTLNGATVGAQQATNLAVGASPLEYVFTSIPAGVDRDALNSGDVGLQTAYNVAGHADWNVPASWTMGAFPTGSTITGATTGSHAFTLTATYSGSLPNPPFVFVNATVRAEVQPGHFGGGPAPVVNYEGTGTVTDNGLGASVSAGIKGATPDHREPSVYIESTSRVMLTREMDGVYRLALTASGSVAITGTPSGIEVDVSGSQSFSPFVPTVVTVDALELSACYTLPVTADPGVTSFQGFTTSRGGRFHFCISSGEIHTAFWNPNTSSWIEGTNRDAGVAPPSGFVQLGEIQSPYNKRLTYVRPIGEMTSTVSVKTDQSGAWQEGAKIGTFFKFPVTAQGLNHLIRFSFSENDDSISGITTEFTKLSKGRIS